MTPGKIGPAQAETPLVTPISEEQHRIAREAVAAMDARKDEDVGEWAHRLAMEACETPARTPTAEERARAEQLLGKITGAMAYGVSEEAILSIVAAEASARKQGRADVWEEAAKIVDADQRYHLASILRARAREEKS